MEQLQSLIKELNTKLSEATAAKLKASFEEKMYTAQIKKVHAVLSDMGTAREYIGTIQMQGGQLVFHIFEYTGV